MLLPVAEKYDVRENHKLGTSKHTGSESQHRSWRPQSLGCSCVPKPAVGASGGRGTDTFSQCGCRICEKVSNSNGFNAMDTDRVRQTVRKALLSINSHSSCK